MVQGCVETAPAGGGDKQEDSSLVWVEARAMVYCSARSDTREIAVLETDR